MRLTDWNLHTLTEDGVDALYLDECHVESSEGLLVVRFPRPVMVRNGDIVQIHATIELDDE